MHRKRMAPGKTSNLLSQKDSYIYSAFELPINRGLKIEKYKKRHNQTNNKKPSHYQNSKLIHLFVQPIKHFLPSTTHIAILKISAAYLRI